MLKGTRMSFGRGSVLSLLVAAGATASVHAQVQWKSGAASPVFGGAATSDVLGKSGGMHVLAKLDRALTDAQRKEFERWGLFCLAPLGDNTFFATVAGDADVVALSKLGPLTGAAAIQTDWKVHHELLTGVTQPWTIVTPGDDPTIAVYVTMHEDAPAAALGAGVAARHGGVVLGLLASVNAMVVHLPKSAVLGLAGEDLVQWIEPAMPRLTEMNAENRALTGANTVNAAPYGLNGTGVSVFVFDGGTIRTTHVDFQDRVTLIDASPLSNHATHVAGTVGGAGIAVANHRGMAPGVTILSAGIETAGQPLYLYSNPVDIEADYTTAFNQGAHLATNSIGTNVGSNGFSCSWQGDYNTTDALIDSMVRGNSPATQHNPFRIVFGAGNERNTGRCGAFYRTIGPPAASKNHLCIGSVDSSSDNVSSFSGWGPTDDGRMKPDFCAPGCQTGGDGGVTSCTSSSDTSYGSLCGTSMSTPTVAGGTALFLQDYRVQFPGPDPRNSTLKAIYAQSAVDRGNAGPDYQYGYGSFRIQAAIDLMRTGNFRESQVSQGSDVSYDVVVAPGATELVLTLAWDDQPGTPNVVATLVNDLDLEVYSPSNARAYPWTLDPNNPAALAVKTQRNSRDNLEQVCVASPGAGTWKVRVKALNVPSGPQPVSIVSSHTLSNGSPFATVAFTAASAPAVLLRGQATSVTATVVAQNDALVPSSVLLHYRPGIAGAFTDVVMTNVAGTNDWAAAIPGLRCGDAPQFYYTADGVAFGQATAPSAGAAAPFAATVGTSIVYHADSMESNLGWTITNTTLQTGAWTRADPEATGAQPEDDTTPGAGVNCWITGFFAGVSMGTNDVDGTTGVNGATLLTSPTFSMLGAPASATISFMRWYETNTITTYQDPWAAEISADNGANWTAFETLAVGAPVQLGWRQITRSLATLGVNGTAQMKLRFRAQDALPIGVVEAAIDDLVASSFSCAPETCTPDFNGDGDVGTDQDIEAFFACLSGSCCSTCGSADFDGDGDTGTDLDIEAFFRVLGGGAC